MPDFDNNQVTITDNGNVSTINERTLEEQPSNLQLSSPNRTLHGNVNLNSDLKDLNISKIRELQEEDAVHLVSDGNIDCEERSDEDNGDVSADEQPGDIHGNFHTFQSK